MKKNLRIVSAAAAALLAIAPVAASTVSTVSAAPNTEITLPNNGGNKDTKGTITLTSNVKAVTFPRQTTTDNVTGQVTDHSWDGSLSGNVTASYKGQTYTVNLGSTSVQGIYEIKNNQYAAITPSYGKDGKAYYQLKPGNPYYVYVTGASINMTTANANLSNEVLGSNGDVTFFKGNDPVNTLNVGTNINGGVYLKGENNADLGNTFDMMIKVVPTDSTNARSVAFFEKSTGNAVASGNLDLSVGTNQTLNVNQLLAAFNEKYAAHQLEGNANVNSGASLTTTANDIKDQLTKQGMSVDSNGNFTPNANFNLNFAAKSAANGATASLSVAVTVKGGKVVTPATVDSVSKRIMHNAYYYDKDGKRVGSDSVKRYASVDVLPNTVTIGGKTYYQVVENGKAVDKYINAGNIDGTKRTLKHNAYVYATSKKRANKVVLKKGEVVTTYGAAYTFKNGKSYYKIGDNTDKTYVKVANFR